MSKFKIIGKSFDTKKEFLDFIVENEDLIQNTRKSQIKEADGFQFFPIPQKEFAADKASKSEGDSDEILVKIVVNSTNVLDSHLDVHMPGLWDKSLKESGKRIMHLQEHGRRFKDVISRGDNLKAYTETVTWKSLGFDMDGTTQILGFDSNVTKEQNPEMFREYSKGMVTEHSVGMQYVKMVTCINSDDYPVQKENWDKYSESVANKEALNNTDVFWAVTEAKAIEGSAVLMGSNSFTPTRTMTPKAEQKEISAIEKWLKK